jgi:hypothetical protein
LTLRAVPHWCPSSACPAEATYLGGLAGEDRWFAFVEGPFDPGFEDVIEDEDVGVLERALAGFGMEWDLIGAPQAWAMLMFLESAPADIAAELMEWEPDELRALRERHVCGGRESFVEALRQLGRYRAASRWDRPVPLGWLLLRKAVWSMNDKEIVEACVGAWLHNKRMDDQNVSIHDEALVERLHRELGTAHFREMIAECGTS